MQVKSKCEVQITMCTGSSFEAARSKYKLLYELAENYGLPNLFDGAVAEYCGFVIKKDKTFRLSSLDTRILAKKDDIEEIAKRYGGKISEEVTSHYNLVFDDISRTDLAKTSEEIEKLLDDDELETVTYYDSYGKECDVKPKKHSKSEAVYMIVKRLSEVYIIPFVIIGGDSQDEDLKMYTENKERIGKLGIPSVFIAPSNIGKIAQIDENVIIGDWENSDGIAECIRKLNMKIKVKEDGEIEL